MGAFTNADLKKFQSESLDDKFQRSLALVGEWYMRWNNEVYVSLSGGKDSTVLADICAYWCSVIGKPLYLVFVDTGLEYPEIRQHVKYIADWLREKYEIEVHLEIIRPKMRFDEVVKKYGYPIISKAVASAVYDARSKMRDGGSLDTVRCKQLLGTFEEKRRDGKKTKFDKQKYKPLIEVDFNISDKCCGVMKKAPLHQYQRKSGRMPIIATMAEESAERKTQWLAHGCNVYDTKQPMSKPLSFWTEQDVLRYIKEEEIPLASVYGNIVHKNDPLQMRLEDYGFTDCGIVEQLCTTGCDRTGCIFCGFGCQHEETPTRFERMRKTHPRQYEYCIGGGEYVNGVWVPNKNGLGLGHVFDVLNKIFGDGFIKY